jgi:hypothetical protein
MFIKILDEIKENFPPKKYIFMPKAFPPSVFSPIIQSTHILYIIEYFIKFGNHLNGVWSIFAICNILIQYFH